VESVEIQRQDSPSFHRSLEISQKTRDSHIPTASDDDDGIRREGKEEESGYVGRGKVEIQRQDSHFPTAPTACGSKEEKPLLEKTGPSLTAKGGDISIEVRTGTFLTRLDRYGAFRLTIKER
jgi:hypothetical protein